MSYASTSSAVPSLHQQVCLNHLLNHLHLLGSAQSTPEGLPEACGKLLQCCGGDGAQANKAVAAMPMGLASDSAYLLGLKPLPPQTVAKCCSPANPVSNPGPLAGKMLLASSESESWQLMSFPGRIGGGPACCRCSCWMRERSTPELAAPAVWICWLTDNKDWHPV